MENVSKLRVHLLSNDHTTWLQIQRSRVPFLAVPDLFTSLERSAITIVKIIEELHERKSSPYGLETRDQRPCGPVALTTPHSLPDKCESNFAGLGSRSFSIVR
jgi:hypothetical protein